MSDKIRHTLVFLTLLLSVAAFVGLCLRRINLEIEEDIEKDKHLDQ